MKNNNSTTKRTLRAVLALCLLAAPGAWAQGGAARLGTPPLTGGTPVSGTGPTAGAVASISNKIQFHWQVPDNQTNYRYDLLDVCPNVVDPTNYGIQSQPYQFQFESNCGGNSNSTNCRFRPNFIWIIHYYTETGASYTEQWQDVTAGDFSKIRLYMYDRVPYPGTRLIALHLPTEMPRRRVATPISRPSLIPTWAACKRQTIPPPRPATPLPAYGWNAPAIPVGVPEATIPIIFTFATTAAGPAPSP